MTWDNFSRDTIQWRLKLAQGEPPTHMLARLTAAILAEADEPEPDLIACTCPNYPCLWFTPPDDLPW